MDKHGNTKSMLGNKNAMHGDELLSAVITFRCTSRLKSAAVIAAKKEGMKLQHWLIKMIEENTNK